MKKNNKKGGNHKTAGRLLKGTAGGSGLARMLDYRRLLLCMLLLLAGLCALTVFSRPSPGFRVGRRAPVMYRAPVDFEYTDRRATRDLRQRKRDNAPLIFRDNLSRFDRSVDGLRLFLDTGDVDAVTEDPDRKAAAVALLAGLRRNSDALFEVLDRLRGTMAVADSDWGEGVPRMPEKVIWRREADGELEVNASDMIVLSAEHDGFRRVMEPVLAGFEPGRHGSVLRLTAHVLQPTARLDDAASRQAAERAADIPPVTRRFLQGDVIVRKDEVVGVEEIRRIRAAYREHMSVKRGAWFFTQRGAGAVMAVLLLGWTLSLYYRRSAPGGGVEERWMQCLALVILTLAVMATASISVSYGLPLYLVPLPALVIVLALIFGRGFAFVSAAFLPALIALPAGTVGVEFPVFMAGGMTAAMFTGRVRRRGDLVKSGFLAGLVQVGLLMAFTLANPEIGGWDTPGVWQSFFLLDAVPALANGILSGLLATILLPAVERIFGVTTDIRLLEWSDPNQPLLQRLLLEAPGTYHHSMIVGSLAADAAEAVGASPLLTRVSAYFHDVGKLKKPEYFAENMQEDAPNPHDELAPTMSRLIITAHPRDGAEMAARNGLPPAVQDIILQSHGTTMTGYFWDRAKERTPKEDCPPEADSFRYKLPKPLSKEAACVMLADAAESAIRAKQVQGAARIAGIVHQIMLDRLHDRQLDASGLTIPDLSRLEDTLVRGLNAAFHKRVKYPDKDETENPQPGE